MKVKVLGCSGGVGAGRRTTTVLLDDDVLIDAGTGLGDLSLDQLMAIQHVFLTHSHLDHMAGLPLFLDSTFDARVGTPVRVHTQPATIAAMKDHIFNGVIWPDFTKIPTEEAPVVRFAPMVGGDVVTIGDREFRAIEVEHAVPTLGFLITHEGRSLGFSSDTKSNETLWPVLNEAPSLAMLVVEVSFPDSQRDRAEASGHYCPSTLAEDLRKLRHTPPLRLTAMKPGEGDRILDEVRTTIPDRDIRPLVDGEEFVL